jgi:hypothetical protein
MGILMNQVNQSSCRTIEERKRNIETVWEYNGKTLFYYVHNGYADQDIKGFWESIPRDLPIVLANGTSEETVGEWIDALRTNNVIR